MIKCHHIFLFTTLLLVTSSCALSQEKEEELSDVVEILEVIKERYMDSSLRGSYKTSDASFHLKERLKEDYRLNDLYPFLVDSSFFPKRIGDFWRQFINEEELWQVRADYFEQAKYQWDDKFNHIIPTLETGPKYPNLKFKKRLSYPLFTERGDKAVVFSEAVASVSTVDFFVFHKNSDGVWKFVCRTIVGDKFGNK